MKELTIEQKAKAYDRALEIANAAYKDEDRHLKATLERIFPELKESEDEKIRKELIEHVKDQQSSFISAPDCRDKYEEEENNKYNSWIAWLEKQGSEPNWCHHKVDLSNCSEEYRKAYYDGWNNCNQQHSQCKSEWNDVVKCLINGMKFYYEDNEEATWGTEKFSMKVKDILSWLEKQGEQKSAEWSEDDEKMYRGVMAVCDVWSTANSFYPKENEDVERLKNWLKSLKTRITWKPSDKQITVLELASKYERVFTPKQIDILIGLKEQLKKLKKIKS